MKGRSFFVLGVLSLALACEGNKLPTGPSVPMDPSKVISDGTRAGGNPDFFFLPPMVPNPVTNPNFERGKFNNALQPSLTVEICMLEAADVNADGLPKDDARCVQTSDGKPLKKFAAGTVRQVGLPRNQSGWWSTQNLPDEGFYYVLWDTQESNLDVSRFYRIKVFLDGSNVPFGFADVDPMSNMREWHNARTGDVIPLIDDRTLPIAFRVERGAACAGGTCNSATITNTSPTGSQSVVVDAGGGSIAGASFPNGWLPSPEQCPPGSACPQSVVVTVTEVNTPGSGLPGEATICHPALDPRLQQFRGCFHYTTTPPLQPFNGVDEIAQPVTVAVCYELEGSGDPREKFAELYASGPNEPPHALQDVSDGGLLGVTTKDCSNPPVIGLESSNPLIRLASAGWRKLKGGLGGVFGVKTAYAVDQGLGGIVKGFSNISPVLPATIQRFSFESVTLGAGQFNTISKVKIVGNHSHTGQGSFAGINNVPVTFAVTANNGTLKLVNSDASPSTSPVTETTSTESGALATDGIAAVEWTVPTAPGTYTMTATGAASGGPITFTATVPAPRLYEPWSGVVAGLSAGPVNFGGPPYCAYTVEFDNMNASLNLNTTGGGDAGVTAIQVEQLASPPCGEIQPNPPHPDQYTSSSVTRNGNLVTVTYVPVGNPVSASLVFTGTMSSDEQSVSGTFTWHRTDQGPPLDWTVVGTATFSKQSPAGIANPVLAFTGSEFYSTGPGLNFVRYNLAVTNYNVYPTEMFAPRPDLPPCGLTSAASRTWVDIYNASNNARIYGFCGLGAPSNLLSIWFAEPVGTSAPAQVYIKMIDRAAGITYTSNNITPLPPP